MKTIEISSQRGLLNTIVQMLGARRKSSGPVEKLTEVNYVMPRVTLDGAHLAKYRDVCGFTAEQGVPLIYPQMLTFPLMMHFMGSQYCPWPAMGTVHLANLIEQRETLAIGDTLRVELSTGNLFAHEKGQVFTLELRIFREEQLVWQATQSLLRVGIKQATGSAYVSLLSKDHPLSRQADFAASGNIGRRYGKVSGDINPIHLSALSARALGFRRALAHGMWTKARALAALLPACPVGEASAAVEFKTPLLLPATPSLWTSRSDGGALFEVRDSSGQKPHLRGQLDYTEHQG